MAGGEGNGVDRHIHAVLHHAHREHLRRIGGGGGAGIEAHLHRVEAVAVEGGSRNEVLVDGGVACAVGVEVERLGAAVGIGAAVVDRGIGAVALIDRPACGHGIGAVVLEVDKVGHRGRGARRVERGAGTRGGGIVGAEVAHAHRVVRVVHQVVERHDAVGGGEGGVEACAADGHQVVEHRAGRVVVHNVEHGGRVGDAVGKHRGGTAAGRRDVDAEVVEVHGIAAGGAGGSLAQHDVLAGAGVGAEVELILGPV